MKRLINKLKGPCTPSVIEFTSCCGTALNDTPYMHRDRRAYPCWIRSIRVNEFLERGCAGLLDASYSLTPTDGRRESNWGESNKLSFLSIFLVVSMCGHWWHLAHCPLQLWKGSSPTVIHLTRKETNSS